MFSLKRASLSLHQFLIDNKTLQPGMEVSRANQTNGNPPSRRSEVWPIESQEHLIHASKQNIFERIPKKWRDYILITLGLIITILLFSVTVILALKKGKTLAMCTSPECIHSASNLLQSMNLTADPCDNFYKFACDNWRVEHVMSEPRFLNNWFEERNKIIKRDMLEFLEREDSDDEPRCVHEARILFDACFDFESMDKHGIETLWRILENIGLPKVPFMNKKPKQSWIKSLAKAKRFLDLEVLIGSGVTTSLKNSTTNQLAIATVEESDKFLRRKLVETSYEKFFKRRLEKGDLEVVQNWKKYSTQLMAYLAKYANVTVPNMNEVLTQASIKIITMKGNISEIESSENVTGPIINDIPDEMSFNEVQSFVDMVSTNGQSKINWKNYFKYLYDDLDTALNFEEDYVLVYKKSYFELLSSMLDDYDEKDLELLIWWEVVYMLSPHVNEELKTLKDTYVSKIVPHNQAESRSTECARIVYNFMDAAVGYSAVDTIDFDLINKVADIISYIQDSFITYINDLTWMDDKTKIATVEKVLAIKKFIGIPNWMLDKDELDSRYENITMNATTFLDNLLQILDVEISQTLDTLRTGNDKSIPQFNPLDINAYYDPSGNAISVPAAIMQFPFYNLGLESLNYGAIGSILGHEMTHSLDSFGRKFDLNGNLNLWWSNKSSLEFDKRTECFVNQYSNYYLPSINETVNGNNTLSENLADDGGLRNAFNAYQMYTKENNLKELGLPGLEEFSSNQLFFLSFAQMWCSEYTDSSLSDTIEYDEHSPQFVRVNKVLQNTARFSEVWNCPVGSKMNPKTKCKLWLD
ncbi:unnamed protein product [Nezara viridula]|uniref:Uncharacterized protein n=1 Tax=Nezara viridula TaxID=85310 RepID=A0A9P0H1V7_NEZVI|nr:unnamed protein product [Nezara viridula]